MNFKQAIVKRSIERILNSPFILLGKLIGLIKPLEIKSNCFLFFPSADLGGSPKVNGDLVSLLIHEKPVVIFSKRPKNNGFANLFYKDGVHVIDLHKKIDNKYYHFINVIYRGIISSWINKADQPMILGGECMYFYKIIQHVKKETKIIEISHLANWLDFNQAYIPFIDKRIVSTPNLKRSMLEQYQRNLVPVKYVDRIEVIDNWVMLPDKVSIKKNGPLNILFVGRGAPQKRVHIIASIAKKMLMEETDISFTFVGDVGPFLSDGIINKVEFYNNISDPLELDKIYNNADILILTSAYEGLPIVIMDAMARGKVVMSTAVDGIPDYIDHLQTGLLIYELTNEAEIINEAIGLIQLIKHNPDLKFEIGKNARKFANEKFSHKNFADSYVKMFQTLGFQIPKS